MGLIRCECGTASGTHRVNLSKTGNLENQTAVSPVNARVLGRFRVCFCSNKRAFRTVGISMLAIGLLYAAPVEDRPQKSSGAVKKQDAGTAVYKPGPDVKAPRLIHYVEPEFSDSSNEAFVDGVVKISTVVDPDGVPTQLHVLSGLNSKEDSTALDAVKQWRFAPGTKAGAAVNVEVMVEVNFHLL